MSFKRHNLEDDNPEWRKRQKVAHKGHMVHRINVQNKDVFDVKFPHFRQPVEIGSFSLDINRTFHNSKKELKYFIKPKDFNRVHFDLKRGYRSMIHKDETQKGFINDILTWIEQNPEKFYVQKPGVKDNEKVEVLPDGKKRDLHTDFVCWRGLLTKLLCTPYENREGWKIAVILYNGTYYMCEFETEGKKLNEENRSEREKEMCCWGWKFEQYLTAESPNSDPDTDSVYNNIEAFCTVVRSRLNSHSLVFSGEVDALDPGDSPGTQHYVEFKTTRELTHPRQHVSFKRYKLIKWWAQSFLVGIKEIVCGYRDDDGIVHTLHTFNVQKIPEFIKDVYNPWKPNVCFNFLDQFLLYVKAAIKTDDHRLVHLLEWSPGNDVSCTKIPGDSEYRFLPDWYTTDS